MPEPARFTPEELDRIEDALENLEGVHTIDDPSPQVRDVLESYRGVLTASRQALPLEEVPGGALAAVFAEARSAAAAPSEVAAAAAPVKKPRGFFDRLRKSFLVPSLALAGTAALVLWISRPQDGAEPMDRPMTAAQAGEATKSNEEAGRASPEADERDGDPADDDQESPAKNQAETVEADHARPKPPAAAAPVPDPEPVVEVEDEDALGGAKLPKAGAASRGLSKIGEAPKDQDKKKADASKPAWDIVERADRARQAGDCAAARSDYMIATEDDDSSVRARAYAGIGLCNMMQGDDAGAEDSFERARGIDPGVDGFINAEREPDEYRSPKRKPRKSKAPRKALPSKKSSKKSKNSAPNVDQAASNPFD